MNNSSRKKEVKNGKDQNTNSTPDTITLDLEMVSSKEIQNQNPKSNEANDLNVNSLTKDAKENVNVGKDFRKYTQRNSGYGNAVWVFYNGEEYGVPLEYTPQNRNSFVLLVLSIVLVMLLVTAAFNVVVLMMPAAKDIFRSFGLIIVIPAMIVMLALNYAFACCPQSRRPPCNYICLVLAVICMSAITAYFTSRYSTSTILYALLSTVIVVMVCMCLACSSFDFTKYLLFVVVIAAAVAAITLVASLGMLISGTYLRPLHLGLLIAGTLIQVIILTIELQAILGGRTVELDENEYAFGAFLLYTSIVDIFIKMLQMIGMLEN